VTTILGLMPMVLKVNIDLFTRQITVGGPSTDWWAQLATAVAGGLAFATLLTLVLTPALLMLRHTTFAFWRRTGQRLKGLARPRSSARGGIGFEGAPAE
jgi:multidrug efflux pump